MSKVDAQRAMKAARHARTPVPATPAPARPAAARATPSVAADSPAAARDAATETDRSATVGASSPVDPATGPVAAAPAASAELCGHRNMAGKDCRRPAGHPEKSHRYS